MRAKLTIVILAGLCCGLIAALTNHNGIERKIGTSDAMLSQRVKSFECADMPLSDAIDMLQRETGQRILVRWKELEAARVSRTAPLTLSLQNVSLSTVLEYIIAQENSLLTYRVQNELIIVSMQDNFGSGTVTRLYDVVDLIDTLAARPRSFDPRAITVPFTSGPMMMIPREEVVFDLIKLIETNASEETWRDNGGTLGSISEFDGVLVISQTPEIQEQIAQIVERLRTLLAADGTTRPTVDLDGPSKYHAFPQSAHWGPAHEEALDVRIPDFVCDHATFTEAIAILRKVSGVNIIVDANSPGIDQIDAGERISLHMKDVSVRRALSILLSCGPQSYLLVWRLRDGVIWINSMMNWTEALEAGRVMETTRIYDVRDLCAGSKSAQPDTDLFTAVQTAVYPESPTRGNMRGVAFQGRLFITAGPAHHLQIEQFLTTLRANNGHPSTRPIEVAPPIPMP